MFTARTSTRRAVNAENAEYDFRKVSNDARHPGEFALQRFSKTNFPCNAPSWCRFPLRSNKEKSGAVTGSISHVPQAEGKTSPAGIDSEPGPPVEAAKGRV